MPDVKVFPNDFQKIRAYVAVHLFAQQGVPADYEAAADVADKAIMAADVLVYRLGIVDPDREP